MLHNNTCVIKFASAIQFSKIVFCFVTDQQVFFDKRLPDALRADRYYSEALETDPNDFNSQCLYSSFLIGCGRLMEAEK